MWFVLTLFSAILLLLPVFAESLTATEQRGQQIYLQGLSPSNREITAVLGPERLEVPAAIMPCVNCHGHDGRGRPEGGVTPSDITWAALTKPYGVTHPSGRQHPPYMLRHLKRAITMGRDPAGQALHIAMPRYRMTHQDLADLVAYIVRLGKSLDPGVTETILRIGAILPPSGAFADMRQAIQAVLLAYADLINQKGGIYNRQLELHFVDAPATPTEWESTVRSFIEQAQVFALTSSFIVGAEAEMSTLLKAQRIPLVGAFTLYPQVDFPLNPYVFYVYAGMAAQARALAVFAASQHAASHPPAAVIYPDDPMERGIAESIVTQCQQAGWPTVQSFGIPRGQFNTASWVQRLRQLQTEILFFLGPRAATNAFLREAVKQHWRPKVFIPSILTDRESFQAPESFNGHLFVAFPTLPRDHTPSGLQAYGQLDKMRTLPRTHLSSQLATLASAKLLVEGLKLAGREISREKLVQALEGLYEFRTGLTPAITYSPNRRIGALGAYITTINLKAKRFVPLSEWIELK